MRSRTTFLAVAALTIATAPPLAAQAAAPAHAKADDPSEAKITIPAESTIPLQLRSSISSRTAYVGQAVYCQTIYPITSGDRIVIPVGTYVKGEVTQVKRPGRVKGKAQLGLRFDSMTFPNGATVSLRSVLSGFGGNGDESFSRREGKIEGDSSKAKDTETVAGTTAEGTVIGGLATRTGKGAGIGALGGGLGGLAMVLATRGKEIVMPAGTDLELQLTRPLVFNRKDLFPSRDRSKGPALPPPDPGPGI